MTRIELTVFWKSDGPLTKRIPLAADGSIMSDGSQRVMPRGTARRFTFSASCMQEFADRTNRLGSHEAWALGTISALRGLLTLLEFRPVVKNTLRGVAVVDIPPNLTNRDIMVHEKGGRRCASLPSKPVLDPDDKQVVAGTGRKQYAPLLTWRTRALSDLFSRRVCELVEETHPGAFDTTDLLLDHPQSADR